MKKRISLMIAMAVCFSMLLGGCGKKLTTENAPDYVKSRSEERRVGKECAA